MIKEQNQILGLVGKQEDCSDNENDPGIEESFKVHKLLAKHDLKGHEEDKDKVLQQRFNKFYCYNSKKDLAQDYFDEKPGFNRTHPDWQIVHEKLLVYGVDYMHKNKIMELFHLDGPQKISHPNLSTCLIEFESADALQKSLERVLLQPARLDSITDLEWLQLKPYSQKGVQRKLQARLCTNSDKYKFKRGSNAIEKETKKIFWRLEREKKQDQQLGLPVFRGNRNPPRRSYHIYEENQVRPSQPQNPNPNPSQSNLSLAQKVIVLDSEEEPDNCDKQSQSLNNFQHSMSLDISNIGDGIDNSQPSIYREPHNIHHQRYFSYERYDREEEEKKKRKQIPYVMLDD